MSSYQSDTPETLYTELKVLEEKIEAAGQNVHFSGQQAAQKRAVYEEKKNKMLIQMFAEEAGSKDLKRTEAQRTALYRTTYATERLEWQLAENEWKASNEYLKSLLGNQISIEVRLKILESDIRLAGRNAIAA
jgi:hypothetical protein